MKTTGKAVGGVVLALALGIAAANASAQTREATPALVLTLSLVPALSSARWL